MSAKGLGKLSSYLSSQVTQWKSDDHVCGLGLLWCVELASVSKHLEVNISAQVQDCWFTCNGCQCQACLCTGSGLSKQKVNYTWQS